MLRPTPFRGDSDVPELNAFFQPERQFAGDARWTFGTSLKSAYANCFEFLNHPPVVQLWRDGDAEIQAVSRLMLGPGEWFYQAAPDYRGPDAAHAIIEQADAALRLLSADASWRTAAYEGDAQAHRLLEEHGYKAGERAEVYMTRSLRDTVRAVPDPAGCSVGELDPEDADQVFARGEAQTDAFIDGQPYAEVAAWMTRTMPHQLAYGRPNPQPAVIVTNAEGVVLSFADTYLDTLNKIGEFEPVGTRKKMHRRGLAKAALTRGLQLMQQAGMQQAIVRTALDNPAAIAAYASVGFEVTDHLRSYRKAREG